MLTNITWLHFVLHIIGAWGWKINIYCFFFTSTTEWIINVKCMQFFPWPRVYLVVVLCRAKDWHCSIGKEEVHKNYAALPVLLSRPLIKRGANPYAISQVHVIFRFGLLVSAAVFSEFAPLSKESLSMKLLWITRKILYATVLQPSLSRLRHHDTMLPVIYATCCVFFNATRCNLLNNVIE